VAPVAQALVFLRPGSLIRADPWLIGSSLGGFSRLALRLQYFIQLVKAATAIHYIVNHFKIAKRHNYKFRDAKLQD